MNLGDRTRRERLAIKRPVQLRHRLAELRLNRADGDAGRIGWHLRLKQRQLVGDVLAHDVGTQAQHLAELDRSRAQLRQRSTETLALGRADVLLADDTMDEFSIGANPAMPPPRAAHAASPCRPSAPAISLSRLRCFSSVPVTSAIEPSRWSGELEMNGTEHRTNRAPASALPPNGRQDHQPWPSAGSPTTTSTPRPIGVLMRTSSPTRRAARSTARSHASREGLRTRRVSRCDVASNASRHQLDLGNAAFAARASGEAFTSRNRRDSRRSPSSSGRRRPSMTARFAANTAAAGLRVI